MDWNVFFATIAQVSATIVAIWGAFIISKILNNESVYNRKKAEIRSVWNISHTLGMKSLMNFKGYNFSKRYTSLIKLQKILPEIKIFSAEDLYLKLDFSWYDNRSDVLDFIIKIVGDGNNKNEIMRRIDNELDQLKEFNYTDNQRESLGIALQSQYVKVYENSTNVYFLLKSVKNNPESSKIITGSIIILAFMFCVGVIYPISFIPTNIDCNYTLNELNNVLSFSSFFTILFSLKGLLISLITIPFYLLLFYFFISNLKLKYKPKSIELLKEFTEKGSYNIHFKYFDDNAKHFVKDD